MRDSNIIPETIYTIGHSTHTAEEFIAMLHSFKIELLADIRSFPGSRRYPHFNKETLQISLPENKIKYLHFPQLGGRRKPLADSKNTSWRLPAFRGYADYMESPEFIQSIIELQNTAMKYRTAYMCSEAVWWSCHRSLVSDYLKIRKWNVQHIMSVNKSIEHPYTKAAIISGNTLSYKAPDLFSE